MEMIRRELRFRGLHGEYLAGRLEAPAENVRAYALFAHCFTCTKDFKSVTWTSRALAQRKIGVLRFDFTGLGESGGKFGDAFFSTNVGDLVAAANMLREHYAAPRALIGHSLGGDAALLAAEQVPETRAVVTIATPSSTAHLADKLARMAPRIEAEGEAELDVMGRQAVVSREMLADLRSHDVLAAVERLAAALLVCHSPDDEVLGIEHAEALFDRARQPKSFLSLAGADHLLIADRSAAEYTAGVIAAWVERYV